MNRVYKFDLHVHTEYSYDSTIPIDKLISFAKHRGLNGLAITDHDTMEGLHQFLKSIDIDDDFIVIPGIEVTTDRGHILLLNIEHYELRSKDFFEVVDYARSVDALIIIPHPIDPFRPFKGLNKVIDYVDGIEVANSSDILIKRHFRRLVKLVQEYGKVMTAGSDAHIIEAIGMSHIILDKEVHGKDELIEYIKCGYINVHLSRTPLTLRLRKLARQYLPLSK